MAANNENNASRLSTPQHCTFREFIEDVKRQVKFCERLWDQQHVCSLALETFELGDETAVDLTLGGKENVCHVRNIGMTELVHREQEWLEMVDAEIVALSEQNLEAEKEDGIEWERWITEEVVISPQASCLIGSTVGGGPLIEALQEQQDAHLEGLSEEALFKDTELQRLMEERKRLREEENQRRLEAKDEITTIPEVAKIAEEYQAKLKQQKKSRCMEEAGLLQVGRDLDHLDAETLRILHDNLLSQLDHRHGVRHPQGIPSVDAQPAVPDSASQDGQHSLLVGTVERTVAAGGRSPSRDSASGMHRRLGCIEDELMDCHRHTLSFVSSRSKNQQDRSHNVYRACRRTTIGFDLMGQDRPDTQRISTLVYPHGVLSSTMDPIHTELQKLMEKRKSTMEEKKQKFKKDIAISLDEVYTAREQDHAVSAHIESAMKQLSGLRTPILSMAFITNQPSLHSFLDANTMEKLQNSCLCETMNSRTITTNIDEEDVPPHGDHRSRKLTVMNRQSDQHQAEDDEGRRPPYFPVGECIASINSLNDFDADEDDPLQPTAFASRLVIIKDFRSIADQLRPYQETLEEVKERTNRQGEEDTLAEEQQRGNRRSKAIEGAKSTVLGSSLKDSQKEDKDEEKKNGRNEEVEEQTKAKRRKGPPHLIL